MQRKLLLVLVVLALALPAWADTRYALRVDGLACPYCAYGVEKKLKALDGVDQSTLEILLNEGLVVFQAKDNAMITEHSLKQLINDAGFTLRGLETQSISKEERKEERKDDH
ncbi:MAG: heavy-metal-associated domain-containing protein [Gammaproteobacteria bacterium]|nr:heavy-metal-associated domain-containing protein [Gammaproteobacteria bacterium]